MEDRDRQLSVARVAYKEAIANLSRALTRFYSCNVPLVVESDSPAETWTARQIEASAALNEAWAGFVAMRSAYDDLITRWQSDSAHRQ